MNQDSRSLEDEQMLLQADVAVIRSNYVTKADLQEVRIELKAEIAALGTDLRAEMAVLGTELRGEMGALGTELRTEISKQGTELRAEIHGVRLAIEKLRIEMQAMRAEFHKALLAQTWKMYGFGVVMVTAVHFVTRAGY